MAGVEFPSHFVPVLLIAAMKEQGCPFTLRSFYVVHPEVVAEGADDNASGCGEGAHWLRPFEPLVIAWS